MNKKVTSLLLVFVMLFSMMATAVPAHAAGSNEFVITPDKSEAYPGDTITYTVVLGPIENFQSANFTLVIPDGLTFVSGATPEGLKELTGATEAGFENSTLTFYHGGLEAYTSDTDTVLMTFTCTVNSDALGEYQIEIMDDWDFADSNWTTYPDMVINTAASKITVVQEPVAATGITLNKETLTLKVGESETLIATLTPDNATDTVAWSSSNEDVATVDASGKVIAIAEGNATITVKAGDVSATCEVTAECAHTNTTEHPANASTCTEQGNDAYTTCDDCGDVISGSAEKLPIDPTNHVDTTTYPAETGSCVDPGHAEYSFCNDCKNIVSGSDTPVTGPHGNYVEKAEEKYLKSAADCENAAVYYKSCELCGEAHATETFTYGDALGHDYSDATCTTPKTCKVCGATEGDALGHSFTNYVSNNDATCTADGTKTATCDRCDETDTVTDAGSAKGHDYADATCTAPKTCKVCGVTEGDVLSHNYATVWSKGEDGHWHECSACSNKIDFAAHDYGTEGDSCVICEYERSHVHRLTLVPGVDATCTVDGNKAYYTCSGCENWFEDGSGSVVISDKTSVVISALGHDLSDATCTEAAACQRKGCGHIEGTALGHSFTNYVSNNDATCTVDGTKTATCDRCDVTDTVADAGSAKGHDYADATCTAPKTCKVCGATDGEALGHSFTNYVSNNDATCTADGTKTATCDRCDATDTVADAGSAKGHDYADATCTAPKTCKICGATDGEALGHSFTNYVSNNDATCTADGTKTATCDRCDATDTVADAGSAKGHDYADATCAAPKTCKVCGATEGEALGHSYATVWSKGEDGHWHECSACGDKADFAAHDYGTEGDTCLICEYERAHVHRLTLVPGVDATCTEGGSKAYYTCSGCEDWFEDASGTVVISDKTSVAIAALGHDMSDATCTEASYCQREGCEYTEGSALGHSFTNYVSNNDATCTADGTKTATCDRCDETDTVADAGSAKGHDYADATCTAPKTCKVCGATEGNALGHSFTNYVSNNDATCTADGTKTATCNRCDATDTVADTGSAKGHDYADATCAEPKTCKVCGATEGEALGHSYATVWSKGEDGHWHECSACGDKADFAAHDYGTEGDTCLICEYERAHVHRLTLVPGVNATCTEGGSKAYYTCSGCEDWFEDASGTVVISDKTAVAIAALGHDMSDATCTEASYCQREGCKYTEGSALGHNYENGWTYDAENHWHKCSRCDAKTSEAAHTPGAEATEETAQTCTICGYEITPALGHTHKLTKVDATVSCTEAGNIAYYTCECGKWFADAEATVEITNKDSVKSDALGHTDANEDNECDVCGTKLENNQPTTPEKPKDDVPQTGDNSNTALWTTLLILSFVGIVVCVIFSKKRNAA